MWGKSRTLILIGGALVLGGCATSSTYLDDTYEQAKKLYESKEYEQAKQYYLQFSEANPQSPLIEVTTYYLANCYKQTGQTDKAKAAYQKLIDKFQSGFWVDLARQEISKL